MRGSGNANCVQIRVIQCGAPGDPALEAGGSTFSETDSVVVRNSLFHHNCGPGIWFDTDNARAIHYARRSAVSDDI